MAATPNPTDTSNKVDAEIPVAAVTAAGMLDNGFDAALPCAAVAVVTGSLVVGLAAEIVFSVGSVMVPCPKLMVVALPKISFGFCEVVLLADAETLAEIAAIDQTTCVCRALLAMMAGTLAPYVAACPAGLAGNGA